MSILNPISVSASPLPATLASLVRSIMVPLGSVAVAQGWVKPENIDGVITIVLTAGSLVYGVWKVFHRTSDLATLAGMVPDTIAQVK